MKSQDIVLSSVRRRILVAVVDAYEDDEPVASDVIAERIDRDAGTIKNHMKELTSLGIVDSVRGRTGGYVPNDTTYEVVGRERLAEVASINLAQDYQRLEVTVSEIDFNAVTDPSTCRAHVRFQGVIPALEPGDPVAIGPTPVSDLVIAGEVVATFEDDEMLIDIATMEAPLPGP